MAKYKIPSWGPSKRQPLTVWVVELEKIKKGGASPYSLSADPSKMGYRYQKEALIAIPLMKCIPPPDYRVMSL